ncbi:GPI ethanolamine phosphate transferase 3-like [Watersipora subatra]|uniref:GPI ethanolamine phosphate transferase 3-like n=1 Tax=Watersipora subatra TaxID=2589382 RepID=UPI00355B5161
MPFVQSLINDYRHQTRLYKFIADPPTTTMQRLKGLTTGSLPTFVDAGSNFASSEINEDNIIQQLINNNKSVVFMGDDTWESLYPGRFLRSYPFPSFNVFDLHTVDRGVKKHLLPEINAEDYSLLIGHFLGVDHCGHRYSPDHPAMANKLTEMDDVIRSVVENLDNDTILIVLGDHGMTKTGDHGGDSQSEVNSALLLHSMRPKVWSEDQVLKQVSQIDLVPTLAPLLGVPVPYSNLGALITVVAFEHKAVDADMLLLKALAANQHQISNYLLHYNQISNDLPGPEMAVFNEMESSMQPSSSVSKPARLKQADRYLRYMKKAKEMCQRIWAKFDINLMLIGCLQVLYTILLHAMSLWGVTQSSTSYEVCLCQLALTFTSLVVSYLATPALYSAIIQSFLFTLCIVICLSSRQKVQGASLADLLSLACLAGLCLCSLSNSLLVYEDKCSHYLTQSVLLLTWLTHVLTIIKRDLPKGKDRNKLSTCLVKVGKSNSTYLLFSLSILVRLGHVFGACRKEQEGCEVSLFFTPLSSLHGELGTYKSIRFWLMSVPAVVLPVAAVRRVLTVRGHLNGRSPLTLAATYALPIISFLVIFDWAAGNAIALQVWQRTLFARAVYFIAIGTVILAFSWPKAIYSLSNSSRTIEYDGSVSSLYNYLKRSLESKASENSHPLVYGLGIIYSAVYIIMATTLALVLLMIAGDGMACSLTFLFCTLLLYLDLHQFVIKQQTDSSITSALCWYLIAKYFFYATGQQQTITSIRWDAAFHGFAQDHSSHIVPAILLFASTFSSQILCSLLLPMLLIVTESPQSIVRSLQVCPPRSISGLGEITLVEQEPETRQRLLRLFIAYLLSHLCKSFASLGAAVLLRRHLMVWKIFAPAFIYEGASFIVTSLACILSYMLFMRITRSLQTYLSKFSLVHSD